MIALDTNILVRYLTMDDADQAARAVRFIDTCAEQGRAMFLSQIALCELVWVLASAYSLTKEELVDLLSSLLRTAQFVVEGADVAHRALKRYQAGRAGFADFLLAETAFRAGCDELATFDRRLLGEESCVEP